MKNFSGASYAAPQDDAWEHVALAVKDDPHALFTDFQWFLYEGRDTVFFTAFSEISFNRQSLQNLVAEMVILAPQLTHGFFGAQPGQPFPQHLLDAVTSIETVDSFDGYPDCWLTKSQDIFERKDLPLFRVSVAVLRNGPDAEGRASVILVRSSHAVLEGSDSALLTRSQSAAHGVMSDKSNKLPLASKLVGELRGWSMTFISIVLANILAPPERPWGFKTLALKRHRLRRLANQLGVRQRSLYFALVTHALNGDGPDKHMSKKAIAAAYTMLDTLRHDLDDDFFRVRALDARFTVSDDFVTFVREIDDTVDKVEKKDISRFQTMISAMFRTMRSLNKVLPFLPGRRFWRFNNSVDIVLTLVPPHRTHGPMTSGMIEPVFCGAWHPATNICTFCPGREYVTFNFSAEQRHIANVDKITELLERVEAMVIPPREKAIADDD